MNVFISGGSKSGKSDAAQKIAVRLSGDVARYYVATMIPCDGEDRARIARHTAQRAGMGFETLEIGRGIEGCLGLDASNATFLIDSVTALLLNEMYPDGQYGDADPEAAWRCIDGLLRVAEKAGNAVFVSDHIYSDAIRYDGFTEKFRADLARIDRALAGACDTVIEMCAGRFTVHKGEWEQ